GRSNEPAIGAERQTQNGGRVSPEGPDHLAGRRIPDGHSATTVSRDEPAPLGGAKGRTTDFYRDGEAEHDFTGRRSPDLQGLIFAARGQALAVGAEHHSLEPSTKLTTDRNRFPVAKTFEVIPFPGATVGLSNGTSLRAAASSMSCGIAGK